MCLMKFLYFFINGSNYDYYFIIKELANELEGQFECLRKNTEKNKPFSVPIENEVIRMGMKVLPLYLIK